MKRRSFKNGNSSYRANSNNCILAENTENSSGFDIWLDLSGKRYYLMHYRHNAMMYVLLKDGISLGELARWKPENAAIVKRYFGGLSKRQIDKMINSVAHVRKTADAYLAEIQETGSTLQEPGNIAVEALLKNKEHKRITIKRERAA